MKKMIVIIASVISIGIIFSIYIVFNKGQKDQFLKENGLGHMSVQQMVEFLDETTNEKDGFYAAVNGSELIIGDENKEYTYPISKDKFYLSFAPYIENTHPCGNHNLVTCRGELDNKKINVLIEDINGNVLIDDEYISMDNGFIGVWLPKNQTLNITVTYNGLSATETIYTTRESNTCLTTLQLT